MGKQTVWEEIDKKSAEILEASDQIWGCAETAFTEHQSMKVLCELLRKEGFRWKRDWQAWKRPLRVPLVPGNR